MAGAYAQALARKLAFDPVLAARARDEVDDHLRAAFAARAAAPAIEAFGEVDTLAAQFAAVWLDAQAKRARAIVAIAVAGAFAAMQLRLASYAAMHWSAGPALRSLTAAVAPLDALAFRCALIVAAIVWVLASRPAFRARADRMLIVAMVAAAALALSVAGDIVLTLARLHDTRPSLAFLVPSVTVAAEITGTLALTGYILRAARRAAGARACLRSQRAATGR
jgi:hypothetical protein